MIHTFGIKLWPNENWYRLFCNSPFILGGYLWVISWGLYGWTIYFWHFSFLKTPYCPPPPLPRVGYSFWLSYHKFLSGNTSKLSIFNILNLSKNNTCVLILVFKIDWLNLSRHHYHYTTPGDPLHTVCNYICSVYKGRLGVV